MARTKYKVMIAGREYSLDYRLGKNGHVRAVEQLARQLVGDSTLSIANCCDRMQSTDVLVAVVWGGIVAGVAPETITPDDVAERLQEHIDQGGDLGVVRRQVRRALLASGVIGEFTQKRIDEIVPPDDSVAVVPQ